VDVQVGRHAARAELLARMPRILREAQGAHRTLKKVLAIFEEPSPDPIPTTFELLSRLFEGTELAGAVSQLRLELRSALC